MNSDFSHRHIGISDTERQEMLAVIGMDSIDQLVDQTIPDDIRIEGLKNIPEPLNEYEYLRHAQKLSMKNKVFKSYIGQGYFGSPPPCSLILL